MNDDNICWVDIRSFREKCLWSSTQPQPMKRRAVRNIRRRGTSTPYEVSGEELPGFTLCFQMAPSGEEKNRMARYCWFGYNLVSCAYANEANEVCWYFLIHVDCRSTKLQAVGKNEKKYILPFRRTTLANRCYFRPFVRELAGGGRVRERTPLRWKDRVGSNPSVLGVSNSCQATIKTLLLYL